jgi:hypothetical protein
MEVMNSVWCIVEVVNKHREWYITYPTGHDEQLKIASDFKAKSSVGFGVCAGTVDAFLFGYTDLHLKRQKSRDRPAEGFLWKKAQVRIELSSSL